MGIHKRLKGIPLVKLVQEKSGNLTLLDGTLIEGEKRIGNLYALYYEVKPVTAWGDELREDAERYNNEIHENIERTARSLIVGTPAELTPKNIEIPPIDANAYTYAKPRSVGVTKQYNVFSEKDEPYDMFISAMQLYQIPDKYLQGEK